MKKTPSLWDAFVKVHPVIFFVIILIISIAWSHWIYVWIWGGSYDVSSVNFWENIIARSRNVLKEEVLWRFLPFTIATFLVLKSKNFLKKQGILILTMGIFIGIVQIQFGLSHMCTDPIVRSLRGVSQIPSYTEKITFVVYQGVLGMFYALIYVKILLHMKGRWRYLQLIPLFATIVMHMAVNWTMVLLGLHGYWSRK